MAQLFGSDSFGSAEAAYWRNAGRDGECWECSAPIETGERIVWDERERRVYCKDCGPDVAGYSDPRED